ncbi:MAG: CynX/NimT family MFS transporter [bacterium]
MNPEHLHDKNDPSRWLILGLVHFSVFSFAVTLQMIPPILGMLVDELSMSYTQAGVLMGLFTLPGIFLALPGGYFADRLGPRIVGICSLILLFGGTLVMMPLKPLYLFLGRFLAGVGGSIIVVVAPQIITRRFLGKELGLAMGIFATAVPLGTIISFNFLGLAGKSWGILSVFIIVGVLSLTALTAYLIAFRQAPEPGRKPTDFLIGSELRSMGRNIWLVALVWALFNMGILTFFTFGIDYFTIRGFGPEMANFLGSLPMGLSIPLVPIFGYFVDRFGWRAGPLIIGSIISGAAILLVAFDPVRAVLWTVLLGLGISLIPPVIFTMAGEVVSPERTGMGFGLLTAMFNAGVFISIPLVGYIKDLTGTYNASFVLISAFSFAGGLAAFSLLKVRPGGEVR